MKKINLNYIKCQHSGEYGLLIEGARASLNAATDGVLAAHDIIEHNNTVNDIGDITDELEALATTWWVRGEFNDLRRDNIGSALSPYEHMASDISLMAEYISFGTASVPTLLKTHACCYDDDFTLMISMARKIFHATLKNDNCADTFRRVSEAYRYFSTVIHYMRRGYRKAVKQYKKLGQIGTNNLFWRLARAIDADFQYIDVGGRLEVCYSLTTGQVKTIIQYT